MTSSTLSINSKRSTFDITILIHPFKFFIINTIVAFIFLFIAIEEIEWALFSVLVKNR